MRRRSAFTLIEMLLTISTGSTLMLLAIGIVLQAIQLASTCRDRTDSNRSVARLAEQFRRDVHQAEDVTVNSTETIEIKQLDASIVTYLAHGNLITREQPLSEGGTRREVFKLSAGSSGKFAALDAPKRAVVFVQSETGLSTELRIDRQIAAVVGRLRRHELAGATLP